MPRFKVFGGFIGGKRAIIGGFARRIICDATGERTWESLQFWAESRNKDEVELATKYPGVLFIAAAPIAVHFKEVPLEQKSKPPAPRLYLRKRKGGANSQDQARSRARKTAALV